MQPSKEADMTELVYYQIILLSCYNGNTLEV